MISFFSRLTFFLNYIFTNKMKAPGFKVRGYTFSKFALQAAPPL